MRTESPAAFLSSSAPALSSSSDAPLFSDIIREGRLWWSPVVDMSN
jgi:hypothetical protein